MPQHEAKHTASTAANKTKKFTRFLQIDGDHEIGPHVRRSLKELRCTWVVRSIRDSERKLNVSWAIQRAADLAKTIILDSGVRFVEDVPIECVE